MAGERAIHGISQASGESKEASVLSRFNCTTKAKTVLIYKIYFELCDGC